VICKNGRRPGRARAGLVRRWNPVLVIGVILAVAGVSSFLVRAVHGSGIPVPAAGQAPATGSSSGGLIYGCARPGRGFSSLSLTVAPTCPPGTYRVSWQVQRTQPAPTGNPAAAPAHTAPGTPAFAPTGTPTFVPTGAPTSAPSGSGQFFGLAPVGTQLPRSDAYCASQVQPMAETVPANTAANHDTPPAGTNFNWGPFVSRSAGLAANFAHVDGNFAGTTGEILEWAACKWGWDQDYAFAEAVRESDWQQSEVGDNGHSFGILQVRDARASQPADSNTAWGGLPWTGQSTALDADAQMAYLRACYDGDTSWLGNGYQAGDAWGCIGSWFSGQWLGAGSEGYISRVQAVLSAQAWPKA
jgi:hypothetical protein